MFPSLPVFTRTTYSKADTIGPAESRAVPPPTGTVSALTGGMPMRIVFACTLLVLPWHVAAPTGQQAPVPSKTAPGPAVSPTLELQVLLDRAGFSPGEIDGAAGANTERAIRAFQSARKLASAQPADLLAALGGGTVDVLVPYEITVDDAEGPFVAAIPADLMEQSKLPALSYTSTLELVGERFHASPALLRRLNPGAKFAAGERILVPNVEPMLPPSEKQLPAQDVVIVVSKSASSLSVRGTDGTVLLHAPVTSGSEHDPLPIGEWAVTSVGRNPVFNYNPDLFWDADPSHAKAKIPAGPNNPVGYVWIDLTKEHYGIHGTPEPGKVGHTMSHGCVRLTNWDALRVAALVKKGTRVVFEP